MIEFYCETAAIGHSLARSLDASLQIDMREWAARIAILPYIFISHVFLNGKYCIQTSSKAV